MPSPTRTLLLVYVLCAVSSARSVDTGDARPCSGSLCPAGRSSRPARQYNPTTQSRSINQYHPHSSSHSEQQAPLSSHRGRSGEQTREDIQTRVAGVVGPVCADCVTTQRQQVINDTRHCKGIECRLPLRVRPKPRVSGTSQPPLVHVADRAAQFLGEFPDIGYPASEFGAPLGVQLTCDIKPGENEVPAEDALILHLQLTKGQEKLVETLRTQQVVIRDLQQRLVEQQGALLSQQREILDQQQRMYEQMDVVKAQYGLLSETVKQVSFQGLQGELQSYFESHLAGLQNQARSHLQKSYAGHKMNVDAKVVNVVGDAGNPLLGCQSPCGPEEYCDFQKDPPQCERCTMCPPGFFLVSQCSPTADQMCQDRDECLELPSLCGERVKCLNTPGGFRCLGVSEREISAGLCGHDYFYNQELQECQACSDCDGEPIATPCTSVRDAVCGTVFENTLSQSWAASIAIPPTKSKAMSIYPGIELNFQGKEGNNLLHNHNDYLNFQQHGLLWTDYNFALKHSCRNFLQVGMRMNGSEEEGHDLSGVRIEQPERKFLQGVAVSAAVEVEPNHTLALVLKSPNQYCNQSKDLQVYELGGSSFSVLWLSHDTGAVAMTAQMSTAAHYHSNYRPTFRIATVSDPYIVALTSDNRGVRFMESGVVKFVLQQAIYSMGHTCVREGFSLIAFINQNGTNQEVIRSFKSGVNYRDTSITLSGCTMVRNGDWLNFEILAPSQCNVRYFGDSSGISMLSLMWIPSAVSSSLRATVSRTGIPLGAVRNKPLFFRQISPNTDQMRLAGSSEPYAQRNFVFSEAGVANLAINLKLIHSCSVVKLTLHRQDKGAQAKPLAQQVGGQMPEGSEWASVGLRTSFDVQNGTAVYVSVDCVRGRINQITHEGDTNISILWVAS